MKTFFIIASLFLMPSFCVFAQNLTSPTPIDPSLISITTDKTLYKPGEAVQVTVSSRAQDKWRIDSYSALRCNIQRFDSEKNIWSTVPMVSCDCDPDVQCSMAEVYVGPNTPYVFSWTQNTSWCDGGKWKGDVAKPGRYQVQCPFSVMADGVSQRLSVKSTEFVIEKTIEKP